MTSLRLSGIRGRLFLAFGSIAAMTVAASIVAWISFGGVDESLDRLVKDNIPTVMLAARLAEKGGVITATAPALASAVDEQDRATAWATLAENLENIGGLLERVDALQIDANARSELRDIISSLEINLSALDANVRRRFWYRERNADLVNRLRWAHADFLDEVEPMIEDARFKIGLAVEQGVGELRAGGRDQTLQLETGRQAALLRLNAAGNLAVGLIARAASLLEVKALDDTGLFLSEVQSRISADMEQLKTLPEALSLRQSLQDVMAFAEGQTDLFQLRRDELEILRAGQNLVTANRQFVSQLQNLITEQVEAGHRTSLEAAQQSGASIERGKLLLLAAAGFSLLVAVLVVWLYVGRNLVRRITSLSDSMRGIADGDLGTSVATGGTDEISNMAEALRTFRDTLAETQAELVQAGKLAALGQLSAGVAHELSQPLAAIRSYAHNARRLMDKDDTIAASETMGRISDLVERMGGTVNHLRTLARRPASEMEAVDFTAVTRDALQLLEGRIREADVHVVVELNEGTWIVNAEAIRLEQVLINLISNAIDSMAGEQERTLSISAEDAGYRRTLIVRDTGTGIAQDVLEHIFEPFFTTKEPGDGVGLGLAISFNIIKDFGGSMRVSSELGKGTAFRISLEKAA